MFIKFKKYFSMLKFNYKKMLFRKFKLTKLNLKKYL